MEMILSHNFMPQITLPTRVTGRIVLIKSYENKCTSANITTYVSDHLPQFQSSNLFQSSKVRHGYTVITTGQSPYSLTFEK